MCAFNFTPLLINIVSQEFTHFLTTTYDLQKSIEHYSSEGYPPGHASINKKFQCNSEKYYTCVSVSLSVVMDLDLFSQPLP